MLLTVPKVQPKALIEQRVNQTFTILERERCEHKLHVKNKWWVSKYGCDRYAFELISGRENSHLARKIQVELPTPVN